MVPAVQGDTFMKKTTTKKKLSLSRETVASLEARDLEQVAGGIISSDNKSCTFSRLVTGCSC
jgi:hypothetical protein